MKKPAMSRGLLCLSILGVCVLSLLALAGPAMAAAPCEVQIDYADVGPTAKNTRAYAFVTKTMGSGAQIDDPRNFSIVNVSGPPGGDLGEGISWVSGVVSYNADTVGTYTVTVQVLWYCEGGGVGSDTDTFTVSIC